MGKASQRKKINHTVINSASEMPQLKKGVLQKTLIHIIFIAVIGIIAYSNTFHVPFQFDDEDFVVLNPLIKKDFENLISPSKAANLNLPVNVRWSIKTRLIGYLTLWTNFHLHGLNVFGYHLFNLFIHILNSIQVYYLVIFTLRTPYFRINNMSTKFQPKENKWDVVSDGKLVALFTALLFVSHPVQTEAVTYITQRFTSLVVLFYLFSVVMYIKARLTQTAEAEGKPKIFSASTLIFYLFSLFSAILAMKTKENAFTLPLVIALCEFSFFKDTLKRRLVYLLPFLLVMLIIPLSLIDMNKPFDEAIDKATRTQRVSRGEYLFTEFRVIITYIRLIFIPAAQNLDYDYTIYKSFLNPDVFLSFLFIAILFSLALYPYYRSRHLTSNLQPALFYLRLISFGIFWFFITLSIESSIVPLYHVIYEHRVYLPSAGAFIAIIAGIFWLTTKINNKKAEIIMTSALLSFIAVFTYTAYVRNTVWESDLSLWADTAEKSPKKARVQYNLGLAFANRDLKDAAVEHFKIALSLDPDYAEAHNNLGAAYISKKLSDKAQEHIQTAIRLKPDFVEAYNNLGVVYETKGLLDKAIEQYQIALKLNPDFIMAHYSLGIIYKSKGLTDKAEEHFKIVRKLSANS